MTMMNLYLRILVWAASGYNNSNIWNYLTMYKQMIDIK